MKPFFHGIAVFYILCLISRRSSATVFSDSTLTCGGQNVTIVIPEAFVNDNLSFESGDSLKVGADNACRDKTVEVPSNETYCYLKKEGSNYKASFPVGSCDVMENQLNDSFSYSYTITKVTNSLVRRHTCEEITFSCFIYGTNDIVTSDHANITDHDQAGHRDQTQQVELRGGRNVLNVQIVDEEFAVFKKFPNSPANTFIKYRIFFAPNSTGDYWWYNSSSSLPTQTSQLELGSCKLSNPADETEYLILTDDNGCVTPGMNDFNMFGIVKGVGNYLTFYYYVGSWSSAVHTKQVITCNVHLCIANCSTEAVCSKNREKRDVVSNENIREYKITSVYDTKPDAVDYCSEDNGGCGNDEFCYNFDNQARCSKVIQ